MTEELRVDTGLVREAGGRLQTIAAEIPPPPTAHSPTGADALSTAIAAKVAEVVDPVLAQMPIAKEALTRYAQNVVTAAATYDAVDRQLAEEILNRVEQFDQIFRGGGGSEGSGGGGGGTLGVGGATAATAGATPGASATSSASGAVQQGGPMGQMMQMPMQMAQQAAQAPGQMAGMAGAMPQAMQQGAQQVMHQVGQLAERAGENPAPPEETGFTEEQQDSALQTGAQPGNSAGERTPEGSAAPPTRSTERGPEIAL